MCSSYPHEQGIKHNAMWNIVNHVYQIECMSLSRFESFLRALLVDQHIKQITIRIKNNSSNIYKLHYMHTKKYIVSNINSAQDSIKINIMKLSVSQ